MEFHIRNVGTRKPYIGVREGITGAYFFERLGLLFLVIFSLIAFMFVLVAFVGDE